MGIDNLYLKTGALACVSPILDRTHSLMGCKRRIELSGYKWEEIVGSSRVRDVVDIRHLSQLYLYESGWNLTLIGKVMNRNHASVLHAVRKCKTLLEVDRRFANTWRSFAAGQ